MLAALHRQQQEYDELVARVNDLERKIEQAVSEPAFSGSLPSEAPGEPAPLAEVITAPDPRIQELESEVGNVREQLAARDAELGQARYSIDVLERQLIDSQHTMHAFAEERLTWEKQFDELEARLAEYVDRIQQLERQLDQVRAAAGLPRCRHPPRPPRIWQSRPSPTKRPRSNRPKILSTRKSLRRQSNPHPATRSIAARRGQKSSMNQQGTSRQ